MQTSLRYLGFLACAVIACNSKSENKGSAAPDKNGVNVAPWGSATTSTDAPKLAPQAAPAAAADANKFLRARPESGDRKSIDACAYIGGFGFACLDAMLAEKNPVLKRYMRRLSDADARQAFDAWQSKNPGGVPHAEFADQCADKGPCGGTPNKSDDGYACLTRGRAGDSSKQRSRIQSRYRARVYVRDRTRTNSDHGRLSRLSG